MWCVFRLFEHEHDCFWKTVIGDLVFGHHGHPCLPLSPDAVRLGATASPPVDEAGRSG